GSEVDLTLGAYERLAAEGIAARVVSVPSMELFARQPQEYRDAVLPPAVPARLAVEAAAPQPWYRWVGDHGAVMGIERFGASWPPARRAPVNNAGAPAASGRHGSRADPPRSPGWQRARRARSRPDRRPPVPRMRAARQSPAARASGTSARRRCRRAPRPPNPA